MQGCKCERRFNCRERELQVEFSWSPLLGHEEKCLVMNKFECSINGMSSQTRVTVLMRKGIIEVESSFIS